MSNITCPKCGAPNPNVYGEIACSACGTPLTYVSSTQDTTRTAPDYSKFRRYGNYYLKLADVLAIELIDSYGTWGPSFYSDAQKRVSVVIHLPQSVKVTLGSGLGYEEFMHDWLEFIR